MATHGCISMPCTICGNGLSDEALLKWKLLQFVAAQKPLDAESKKILYDNLWELYD